MSNKYYIGDIWQGRQNAQMEEMYLLHYGRSKLDGAKKGSGRYPLGSGKDPYQDYPDKQKRKKIGDKISEGVAKGAQKSGQILNKVAQGAQKVGDKIKNTSVDDVKKAASSTVDKVKNLSAEDVKKAAKAGGRKIKEVANSETGKKARDLIATIGMKSVLRSQGYKVDTGNALLDTMFTLDAAKARTERRYKEEEYHKEKEAKKAAKLAEKNKQNQPSDEMAGTGSHNEKRKARIEAKEAKKAAKAKAEEDAKRKAEEDAAYQKKIKYLEEYARNSTKYKNNGQNDAASRANTKKRKFDNDDDSDRDLADRVYNDNKLYDEVYKLTGDIYDPSLIKNPKYKKLAETYNKESLNGTKESANKAADAIVEECLKDMGYKDTDFARNVITMYLWD